VFYNPYLLSLFYPHLNVTRKKQMGSIWGCISNRSFEKMQGVCAALFISESFKHDISLT